MAHPSQNLTIKDIARLSGVGKSTVSRVLNNDQKVKPETREKVLEIIKEYRFVPSKSARAMRGYQHKVVGIIVSRLDSYAENQAVRAMLPIFYQNGIDPIILESQFDTRLVNEHLQMLASRQTDGIIMFSFSGLDITLFKRWREKTVMLAQPIADYSSVCYDDSNAVTQLLNYFHLIKKHNDIGYIGVNLQDATTGAVRFQAYMDFCRRRGLNANAQCGELNYQSGYRLAEKVLSASPSAILCATDTIAIGLCKYLQQNAIGGIDVASIGNSDLLRFLFPQTVSVDLGFYQAGKAAAEQLIRQLNSVFQAETIVIPSRLHL
jgi:LacI family trehalose operon transcriptional repressor